jgi:hypothetical protein
LNTNQARREDIITRADEISSIVKKTITVPRRLSKLVMKVEALQELFRMLRRFALEVPMEFSALFMNKKFIGEFVRVCATLAMFDRDIGDAGILCCHDIVNGLLKGVDADDIPAKARDCVSIILRYLVDQIRCEDLEVRVVWTSASQQVLSRLCECLWRRCADGLHRSECHDRLCEHQWDETAGPWVRKHTGDAVFTISQCMTPPLAM